MKNSKNKKVLIDLKKYLSPRQIRKIVNVIDSLDDLLSSKQAQIIFKLLEGAILLAIIFALILIVWALSPQYMW